MASHKSRNNESIRRDFLEAIERIKNGQPRNHDLKALAKKGKKIRVNVSNVAKEADRARGLIARDNSAYPDVRQKVLDEMAATGTPARNSANVISELRAQVGSLRAELHQAKDLIELHQERRQRSEIELEASRQQLSRAREEIDHLKTRLIDTQRGNRVVSIT